MIINDDILNWCKEYKGEPYHALLCDPPYHLYSPVSHSGSRPSDEISEKKYNAFNKGGFMGKKWDGGDIAFRSETWIALSEYLYDGAFIIAFASARGFHRMAVAMEDAGLIMHPFIGWAYGSGFPKATRIDTQIQPKNEQDVVGNKRAGSKERNGFKGDMAIMPHPTETIDIPITEPTDPLAKAFVGHRYGLQALKPALEPILVFQKPYRGKPVECITKTGAGALNIDEGRIGSEFITQHGRKEIWSGSMSGKNYAQEAGTNEHDGRWPANLILSHTPECKCIGAKKVKVPKHINPSDGDSQFPHSGMTTRPDRSNYDLTDVNGTETISNWECPEYCPVRRLGEQSGESKSTGGRSGHTAAYQGGYKQEYYGDEKPGLGDTGTASRFFFNADWNLEQADPLFYMAKAARSERENGLLHKILCHKCRGLHSLTHWTKDNEVVAANTEGAREVGCVRCVHPTVKPISLTQHLATLLLPPEEYAPRRILVPFAGVGSEMIGCFLVGWEEIEGIELDPEYCKIAQARLDYWQNKPKQEVMELKI